jgi:thymidylate synthase (FAD)
VTKQFDIIDDSNYRAVLDHGFVGVVDHMGSDAAIVQAARVSYGAGTKTVNEDRGLIRYLMRMRHTSPIEMAEVKFHIKAPIFVFRQLVRHRTASLNEESARYSEMSDEFYIPEDDHIQPQAKDNKQGRAGTLSDKNKSGVRWYMEVATDTAHQIYKVLLGNRELHKDNLELIYTPYAADSSVNEPLFEDDFPGIARESARGIMPLNAYSSMYWKCDLHNLFHFIKLRADSHAQYEIRVYADAILDLITPLFPHAVEAFHDYVKNAATMSRMDLQLIKDAIACPTGIDGLQAAHASEKAFAESYGMTLRELRDLKARFG